MYAIHINDRIKRQAGFLGTADLWHAVTDVREIRRFATKRDADACLAEMRATPQHPVWAGSRSIAYTVVELDA